MFLGKIALIAFLNCAALFGLIRRLILRGNTRAAALRIAWKMVIGRQTNLFESLDFHPLWSLALPMSWWIMNLCFIAAWLVVPEFSSTVAFVLLIVVHGIWYMLSFDKKEEFNRFVRINQQFGVVFKEIGPHSEMSGKSLAELDLRKKELLVLAVERDGRITPFPKGMEVLETGDRLVIFGDLNSYRTIFGVL